MNKNKKKSYQKPEFKKFFREPRLKKEGRLSETIGSCACGNCGNGACTGCGAPCMCSG